MIIQKYRNGEKVAKNFDVSIATIYTWINSTSCENTIASTDKLNYRKEYRKVMKKTLILRSQTGSNIKYYHDNDIQIFEAFDVCADFEVDYVIVEDKTQLDYVIKKYGYTKILKDLIFHNFYINRAIQYKEFGLKNSDLSVISNWCGGGFIYSMLGISNNGPCVWGYTANVQSYIYEINNETFFNTPISEMTSINGVPVAKIGNAQINYNHYKDYSDQKIINLHEERRKKFNYQKYFSFSIAHNITELDLLTTVKGPHIILTSLDVCRKNVISKPNFQMRVWNSKPDELWKYAQRYLTTDYDLIGFLEDVISGEDGDINDYKIDPTENIFEYVDNNSENLIIIFSSVMGTISNWGDRDAVSSLRNRFTFYQITKNKKFNYLFVRDSFSELYGFYIQNYDDLVFWKVNQKITDFLTAKKFKPDNVTAFGFSKGGTAALLYSMYNSHIGNAYVGTPIVDFTTYFDQNKEIVYQHLRFYADKMMNLFCCDNKFTNTNIKLVSAVADIQINSQINLFEKLEKNKKLNFKYEIEINGHGHGLMPKLELEYLLKNLFLFAIDKDETINSNFVGTNNQFELLNIVSENEKNINLEKADTYIYSELNELIIVTNYHVTNIQIAINDNIYNMNKLSKNIYSIPFSNSKEFIFLYYNYATRVKEIHINSNKLLVR